jgi:membrane fusion protein, heavy metal efflux system
MIKKFMYILILSSGLILLCCCVEDSQRSESIDRNTGRVQAQRSNSANRYQKQQQHRHHGRDTGLADRGVIMLSAAEKNQVRIKTIKAEEKPIRSTLKAMGKVLAAPEGKAIVGCAFPGRIRKLHTAIGQWVKKDDALVTLESEAAGNAKSEYLKALAQYRLAAEDSQREEHLFQKDIGAKKDLLETRTQLEIAGSDLEAAEKRLQLMGFSPKQAEASGNAREISPYLTVNAPISGRIIQNNAVLGAMIEPDSEIMIILNPTTLCIDAEIYEKDLAKIKPRQEVQIAVPAYPEERFTGVISYIGDIVHPETRTITVRTRVPNEDFKLKPGMFADIEILVEHRQNAITVPTEAVLDDLDRKIVFLHQGEQFICQPVEVGAAFNGFIEISSGVAVGDAVVVEGNYQLKSKLYEETLHQAHVH